MPELGRYRLAELDHDVVQEMIERMLSGDADEQQRKKSASTVRNAITALRAMWRHPSARKSQPGNPMDGLALPASPRDGTGTPPRARPRRCSPCSHERTGQSGAPRCTPAYDAAS